MEAPRVAELNMGDATGLFSMVAADDDKDFACTICLGPLNQPTQVICRGVDEGHRACRQCLKHALSCARRCPRCNVSCVEGALDGRLVREMRTCKVRCDLCEWCGEWQEKDKHLASCEAAAKRFGWKCPIEECDFTAQTEPEVEAHMLVGFREHVDRAASAISKTLYPGLGLKDSAQVDLPDVAAFHEKGESLYSPLFIAASGYVCVMRVQPDVTEAITVLLQFLPFKCDAELAPFPFPRPYMVMVVDANQPQRTISETIKFHLTAETRLTDPNICPPSDSPHWTGGIVTTFSRATVQSLNASHLLVNLVVLDSSPAIDNTIIV